MRKYLYTQNDGTEEARKEMKLVSNVELEKDFEAGQRNYNLMLDGKLNSIQLARDPDKELAYWK